MRPTVAPHPLHISQQRPKKRMSAQRGRIAHHQQLAPCTGHAQVHAADVRQEADLALGLAARQGDLEKRSDMLISTMRHCVESMGGKLELVAKFPDRPSVVIDHLGGEVTLNQRVNAPRRPRAAV